MSDVGKRLKEERLKAGLSQAEFGELGGVKVKTQGAYERGDRSPDTTYLSKVSEKADVAYIVSGEKNLLEKNKEVLASKANENGVVPFDPKTANFAAEVTEVLFDTFHMEQTSRSVLVPMVYSLLMGGQKTVEDIIKVFDGLPYERR